MKRAAAGLGLLATLAACAPPVWDVAPLEAREPQLRAVGAHRLGDAIPYLLPNDGELVLFLCRWATPASIPVSLPPEATPAQRRALDAALMAWEGAGLGVRFVRGAAAGVGIDLRFVSGSAHGAGAARTATTLADCALQAADGARGERLAARLVGASIELRVDNLDSLGRRLELSAEELAGSALHELGHALGFQGHVRAGESALRFQVDSVRRAGRRVLAGESFRDPALSALYAVASGVVVGRVRVPPARTLDVDRMLALVRAQALSGPIARMGDLEGQLLFRDPAGAVYALWLRGVAGVLAGDSEAFEVVPGPRTARRLSLRSRPGGSHARGRPAPPRPARASATPRRVGTT